MKVVTNSVNNISPTFTSHSARVRKADDVVRLAKTLFPVVSSSNIKKRAKGNVLFKNLFERVSKRIGEKVRCHSFQPDSLVRAMMLAAAMKKNHVGNCAELSRVTNLVCKVNGIDAIPFKFNMIKNGKLLEVDHMALAYPLKKLPDVSKKISACHDIIIIDPWLGFADYAPKAMEKYKLDLRNLLGIKINDELVFNPNFVSKSDKLYKEDISLLREKFPKWFERFSLSLKSLQK